MSTNMRSDESRGSSPHLSVEEINDLVDGLLTPERERQARAHLAECAECRRDNEALADAVAGLGRLPLDAAVPEGVGERINGRISARDGTPVPDAGASAGILPFPGPSGDAAGARRGPFGARHLAAAAAVAAVLSGGAVWLALGPGAGGSDATTATTEPAAPAVTSPARFASTGGQAAYDLAVRELELLVHEGADVLAPETLAALETSLATIDAALADVRQALEEDPSSELLRSLLVNHQTARIRVLRQAASRIQASS